MDEVTALAAARAFGIPAGPLRALRAGPSPLFGVKLADGRRVALRLNARDTDRRTIDDGLRLAECLADAGFATPWPQRTCDGSLTATVAGISASALQWVPAMPLAETQDAARLHAIGALLADFHLTAAAVAPMDLHLPDRRASVPVAAAVDDPALARATDAAQGALAVLRDVPVGVVLDDPGAVLAGADGLWLIGVDKAGRGWRAQDLAAALWRHADTPDLPTMQEPLVAGYVAGGGDARDAALDQIAACLLLRALRAAANATHDAAARARAVALADSLPS